MRTTEKYGLNSDYFSALLSPPERNWFAWTPWDLSKLGIYGEGTVNDSACFVGEK
jgi:hypothetical protein